MYPPAVFQNVRLKQRLFIEGEQLLALRLLFLLLAPGLTRRRTFRRRLFAPGTWFDHLHGSFTLRSIPSGIVRQLLRGRLLPGTNRERRYFGRLSSPIFRDNRPVLRTLLVFCCGRRISNFVSQKRISEPLTSNISDTSPIE